MLWSRSKKRLECVSHIQNNLRNAPCWAFFWRRGTKVAAGAANIEDELCAWAPNYIFFCACRQQADRRLERVSEKHLTQCHCVCSSLSAIGTWPCIIHARALSLAHHLETKKRPAELSKAPLNLDRTRIRPVGMARISPTRARERTSVNTRLELWPENNIALGARTFCQLAVCFVCLLARDQKVPWLNFRLRARKAIEEVISFSRNAFCLIESTPLLSDARADLMRKKRVCFYGDT